jgi:hypothetical protein
MPYRPRGKGLQFDGDYNDATALFFDKGHSELTGFHYTRLPLEETKGTRPEGVQLMLYTPSGCPACMQGLRIGMLGRRGSLSLS